MQKIFEDIKSILQDIRSGLSRSGSGYTKINATQNGYIESLEANKLKEIPLREVIDYLVEVPAAADGGKTVYLSFNPGQQTKDFPIAPGESRSFSPSADNARYNKSIYLSAAEACNVRILYNIDGGAY